MKKILVGGVFYGLHNIGDEAILQAIIENFSGDDIEVHYKTYGSEWAVAKYTSAVRENFGPVFVRPKFGLFYANRKSIKNLPSVIFRTISPDVKDYKGYDLYVCGGATILSDCPWYSLRTVLMAKKAGVPSILWGVGMAEVYDDDTLQFIRTVCNDFCVKHIYTRDEFTLERLKKCGVVLNKLSSCYDPALMIDASGSALEKYLSDENKELLLKGNRNICLSISGEADVLSKTPIQVFGQFIEKLLTNLETHIFLVPTGCGKHCKDRELLRTLKIDKRVHMIEQEFAPEDLCEFLKYIAVIVSSRLHLNIFGATVGTPSIGLVRNAKIIDFATLFSFPYVELNRLEAESLCKETNKVLANRKEMSWRIISKRDQLRAIHKNAIEEVLLQMNCNS